MTNAWNELLTAALLGTERGRWNPSALPPGFAPLQEAELDAEDRLLQAAAALINYRRCGAMPAADAAAIAPAPEEVNAYAPAGAVRLLPEIFEADSLPLLQLWLDTCAAHARIVPPEWIPQLYDKAVRHEQLRALVATVCGQRGAWLSAFHPEWNFAAAVDGDVWETGTLAQRVGWLRNLRNTDAAAARERLQQVWSEETAAARAELLSAFDVVGAEDLPWLETLLSDKSVKVREVALALLKKLPESRVVQRHAEVLARVASVRRDKGVLGIGAKTIIEAQPAHDIEDLFSYGISKTSSEKGMSDEEHLLHQLTAAVPPLFWEQHLQTDPEGVVVLLQKQKTVKPLLHALAAATVRFADRRWARAIATKADEFYQGILRLLPHPEWERYAQHHFKTDAAVIIPATLRLATTWSTEWARTVLRHMAQQGHGYQPAFYAGISAVLPVAIVPQLEQLAPSEPTARHLWERNSALVARMVGLRTQTVQAFASD